MVGKLALLFLLWTSSFSAITDELSDFKKQSVLTASITNSEDITSNYINLRIKSKINNLGKKIRVAITRESIINYDGKMESSTTVSTKVRPEMLKDGIVVSLEVGEKKENLIIELFSDNSKIIENHFLLKHNFKTASIQRVVEKKNNRYYSKNSGWW